VQSTDPKARARAATINSDALRKHFSSLMSAFLEPFQAYLTPGPSGKVPPWDAATFLASVKSSKAKQPLLERYARVVPKTAHAEQLHPFLLCT
jgi:hypothetical protein